MLRLLGDFRFKLDGKQGQAHKWIPWECRVRGLRQPGLLPYIEGGVLVWVVYYHHQVGPLIITKYLFYFFPSPPIRSGEVFSSVIFSSLSLLLFVFFGCSDGMEREACVCDHGFERSDLCAEIIIIIIIMRVITVL